MPEIGRVMNFEIEKETKERERTKQRIETPTAQTRNV
jgi:hypothetical protein